MVWNKYKYIKFTPVFVIFQAKSEHFQFDFTTSKSWNLTLKNILSAEEDFL